MSRVIYLVIFLSIFSAILLLGNYYIFSHIVTALALSAGASTWLAVLLGSLSLLIFLAFPITRFATRKQAAPFAWLAFSWMGMLLLMLTAFALSDLFWTALTIATYYGAYNPENLSLLHQRIDLLTLGISVVLSLIAIVNGLRPVVIKSLTVKLNKLPLSFQGFRLVQISDLHIGPLIDGKWLKRIVDQVNHLNPDIIVLTGDLVDGSVNDLREHVAPLAELRAKHGIYFITGNHEYYSGVDEWCAHVSHLGLTVLRNERVKITNNDGDSFDLVGVDDWAGGQFGQGPDLPKALAGRDDNHALILLAHQPAAIAEAAQHKVDLQLSGHTHGGQIWPFNYLVYLQQPYSKGLHRYKNTSTQIYTSAGTGFWGPPMRLGTKSEITHITLHAEPMKW